MSTAHEQFLPTADVPAQTVSVSAETYALITGQTLLVKVNRGGVQTVTFLTAHFVDIGNATATEVATAITTQLVGCLAFAFTSGGSVYVRIVSVSTGRTAYLEVTGGTANAVLNFALVETVGLTAGVFSAVASPNAGIDLTWVYWGIDAGQWNGDIKILAKQGEYAREHDDTEATTVFSASVLPSANSSQSQTITGLTPGVVYYFTLFYYRSDYSLWAYDDYSSFAWAYGFGNWNHGKLMFDYSPDTYQRHDVSGDWADFLGLLGTVFDGAKTDVEQILTLFDINEIRASFIPQFDYKHGWPTNIELPEKQQRTESLNTIPLWKKKGRKSVLEAALEQVTRYSVTCLDGWKYVMFSNDGDCLTPDTTNSAIPPLIGLEGDLLKYTPDIGHWHDLNGWGIYFEPIPSVSGDFTYLMSQKMNLLAPYLLSSEIDYSFIVELGHAEEDPEHPLDETELLIAMTAEEAPPVPEEEDVAVLAAPYAILDANIIGDLTNDRHRVTPHSALSITP